jgi:hypothetical protein
MTLKLMALDVDRRSDMWLSLCVDSDVISHLTGEDFITYDTPRIRVPGPDGKEM